MTPIAGALTITWTNQYVGNHRICYRQVTAPPSAFVCINNIPCPNPPGSVNTYTIPVVVDNDTCDVEEWEVYVQASCEDETSANGRVYVSPNPSFTPNPTCLAQSFTCSQVAIDSFDITNPGSNYAGTEVVTIDGVPGTITIGLASPTAFLNFYDGSCLVDGVYPGVSVLSCSVGTCAGVGTFTITVTGNVVSAIVADPGCTGFSVGDRLTFNSSLLGCLAPCACNGPLTNPVIDVTATDYRTVVGITPGTSVLYSTPPTVVIAPPTFGPGTTATAVAILGNCPNGWDAGINCLTTDLGNYPTEVALGLSFNICYEEGDYNGTETIADLYDIYGYLLANPAECCFDCVDVEVDNQSGGGIEFTYIDCVTKELVGVSIPNNNSPVYTCVVNNSWSANIDYTNLANNVTITTNSPGSCTP